MDEFSHFDFPPAGSVERPTGAASESETALERLQNRFYVEQLLVELVR